MSDVATGGVATALKQVPRASVTWLTREPIAIARRRSRFAASERDVEHH
ncbi:hypothetical protein [uncultured Sphingomonas sp.]